MLPLDPQEKLGGLQETTTQRSRPATPRLVQLGHLAAGELVHHDRGPQCVTVAPLGPGHGHQVLHRDLGRYLSSSHTDLDRLRKLTHQGQTPGDETGAPVETSSKLLQAQREALVQLGQKPALLDGRLALGGAQRAVQQQGLGGPHGPHRGLHRVLAQLLQRSQALVAVNHQVALLSHRHHHDGDLLTTLGQRGQKTALTLRTARPQSLVAQVQLVKLQLHRSRASQPDRASHQTVT